MKNEMKNETENPREGHYRIVMKSNHLGVADLEDLIDKGTPLIFTIEYVQREYDVVVAGKKTQGNFAYFKEGIKPLMINATNAKRIREFVKDKSPLIQHWKNILVEFYIDKNVKFGGELTGGIRVKIQQPKPLDFVEILPAISDHRFQEAISAIRRGKYTKEELLSKRNLSIEQLQNLGEI